MKLYSFFLFLHENILICFVLRFYCPVDPMGSCQAQSVYLATCLLGRLVNQYCAHSFTRNLQLPFLNQQQGENDLRKYFMINPYERMPVSDQVGVEPATSWSPVGRASNWATESGHILIFVPCLLADKMLSLIFLWGKKKSDHVIRVEHYMRQHTVSEWNVCPEFFIDFWVQCSYKTSEQGKGAM